MAPPTKPTSIRDVARASGVSPTTVSLVLNGSDQRISSATRKRVLATIKKMEYRPNRLAQGLQNRKSNIMAVLVPQLEHTFADPYFGELISGVYDQASSTGYKLLLEVASDKFISQQQYLELYDRCFVDGMIFMGSHSLHTFVRDFKESRRPFILADNLMFNLNHVVCDYVAAGELAANHLVQLGHRRIAMIRGPVEVETAKLLRRGFIDALANHKIQLSPKYIEDGQFTEEAGAAAAEALIRRAPDITAIFAGNDKMAIGAMQRLLKLGRNVPGNISVVGCDDVHQSAYVTPALTTIRTPRYELGRECCKCLMDIINEPDSLCQQVMPVELIVRQSTAAPPLSTE